MTTNEAGKLLAVVAAAYPQHFTRLDTNSMARMAAVWASVMPSETFDECQTALRAYIRLDTSGFPPAPGQVAQYLGTSESMTEQEAWARVSKSISRSGYYAAEEFDKLPPILQEAVGGADMLREWAHTDYESIQTVVASNFQRTFRAVLRRHQERAVLPDRTRIEPPKVHAAIEEKPESAPPVFRDRRADLKALRERLGVMA